MLDLEPILKKWVTFFSFKNIASIIKQKSWKIKPSQETFLFPIIKNQELILAIFGRILTNIYGGGEINVHSFTCVLKLKYLGFAL